MRFRFVLLMVTIFGFAAPFEVSAFTPKCLKVMERTAEKSAYLSDSEKMILAKLIGSRKTPEQLTADDLNALAKFGVLYAESKADRDYFNKMLNKLRIRDQFDASLAQTAGPLRSGNPLQVLAFRDEGFRLAEANQSGFFARHRMFLLNLALIGGITYLIVRPDHTQIAHDWISTKATQVKDHPTVQKSMQWAKEKWSSMSSQKPNPPPAGGGRPN